MRHNHILSHTVYGPIAFVERRKKKQTPISSSLIPICPLSLSLPLQSPVHSTLRSPLEAAKPDVLKPCDAKALLDNVGGPVHSLLEGVDVQRGYGMVRTEDGRQAELATVAVDAWHIREFEEEELVAASLGQLHEGDTYVIRWKYSVTTVGE